MIVDVGTLIPADLPRRFFGDRIGAGYASSVRHLLGLALLLSVVGCANAPAYRPIGPPMNEKAFEAGVGVHGVVGQDVGGIGAGAWVVGQVAKDIFLVARGHHTELIPYRGYQGVFLDSQFGGSGGFRGLYRLSEDLFIGGEVTADYLSLRSSVDGSQEHFVSGVASFPVAERAFENFWFYVQPTVGAGYRFAYNKEVDVPFSGFMEVPIGVAWKANDSLVVVGEGGFAIPFTGGYLGLALAWRL